MVFYLATFFTGLLVGSFLNVVIYRLHSGESIIKKRSHCLMCSHVLVWYELVPVVSFLIQKGKCRACKASISWQYLLVELATGLLFVLMPTGDRITLGYLLFVSSFFIIIFVYDARHYIIPDKIIYPAIATVFLYRIFEIFRFGSLQVLLSPLFSAVLACAFFAGIFFVSRGRWLGFGDVKLAFLMGLFLGWPKILVALFAGFILGGIIGIGLIATHKKTMKSQVPFGPFLVAGTFIAMFFGDGILEWYMALLR